MFKYRAKEDGQYKQEREEEVREQKVYFVHHADTHHSLASREAKP
jgi:hypothetical protein